MWYWPDLDENSRYTVTLVEAPYYSGETYQSNLIKFYVQSPITELEQNSIPPYDNMKCYMYFILPLEKYFDGFL
jgi:hypothetical protein